jgi:hypothetical protein
MFGVSQMLWRSSTRLPKPYRPRHGCCQNVTRALRLMHCGILSSPFFRGTIMRKWAAASKHAAVAPGQVVQPASEVAPRVQPRAARRQRPRRSPSRDRSSCRRSSCRTPGTGRRLRGCGAMRARSAASAQSASGPVVASARSANSLLQACDSPAEAGQKLLHTGGVTPVAAEAERRAGLICCCSSSGDPRASPRHANPPPPSIHSHVHICKPGGTHWPRWHWFSGGQQRPPQPTLAAGQQTDPWQVVPGGPGTRGKSHATSGFRGAGW